MSKRGKYNSPWQATLKGITDLYGRKTDSVQLPGPFDLTGKTVMITGASSGLGFAAAQRMATAGAEIIMAVRSGIPEKGEEIKGLSGNAKVKMYRVDLSDFNSIDQFVENLMIDSIKIDILVSNAAMVPLKSRRTPQGLEEMFMVNYLSAFYLINSLINRGIFQENRSSISKIIIVSSESHRNPEDFNWEKFGVYEAYGMRETVSRYGYFKLLLTTFANALSMKLTAENRAIAVRVLCPGPINSNIAREAPSWMQPMLKLVFSIFFKSPYKACEPILYFAASADGEDSNNQEDFIPIKYMFLMQPKAMDEKATEKENGEKLWHLSEQVIRKLGFGS